VRITAAIQRIMSLSLKHSRSVGRSVGRRRFGFRNSLRTSLHYRRVSRKPRSREAIEHGEENRTVEGTRQTGRRNSRNRALIGLSKLFRFWTVDAREGIASLEAWRVGSLVLLTVRRGHVRRIVRRRHAPAVTSRRPSFPTPPPPEVRSYLALPAHPSSRRTRTSLSLCRGRRRLGPARGRGRWPLSRVCPARTAA
jgi:hypothetical protein